MPLNVQTDAQFNAFIAAVFPAYAQTSGINSIIESRYPPILSPESNYTTERARLKAVEQDANFVCYVRFLSDAYAGKHYNLQYSVTPGLHGTDLLPTFYNLNLDLGDFPLPLVPGFWGLAQAYQSYLTSHARTGDPNAFRKIVNLPPAIRWPMPGGADGDTFTDVLEVGDLGFRLIEDGQTARGQCGFWRDVQAALTGVGGKSPFFFFSFFSPLFLIACLWVSRTLGGRCSFQEPQADLGFFFLSRVRTAG